MMSTPKNHRQDSDFKNRGHHKNTNPNFMHYQYSGNPRKNDHKMVHVFDSPPNFWSHLRETPWSSTHPLRLAPENVDTAVDPRSAWHCARLPPCDRRGPECRGPKVWLRRNLVSIIQSKDDTQELKPTWAAYTYYVYIFIYILYIYIFIYNILEIYIYKL